MKTTTVPEIINALDEGLIPLVHSLGIDRATWVNIGFEVAVVLFDMLEAEGVTITDLKRERVQ